VLTHSLTSNYCVILPQKQKLASQAAEHDQLKHSQHHSNLHKKVGKGATLVRTNGTANKFLDAKFAVEYTRKFSVYRSLPVEQH